MCRTALRREALVLWEVGWTRGPEAGEVKLAVRGTGELTESVKY